VRGDFATDERVHLLRDLRAGGLPGPDRPDRLIGDDRAVENLYAGPEERIQLLFQAPFGLPVLALAQTFADAQDRHQARSLGRQELRRYCVAALAVVLPSLRMTHQAIARPDVDQHRRRGLAGVGTLFPRADILRAERQPMRAIAGDQLAQIGEWRQDDALHSFRRGACNDGVEQLIGEPAVTVQL